MRYPIQFPVLGGDPVGPILSDVTIEVLVSASQTPARIYAALESTTELPNPTSVIGGFFRLYVDGGRYDISIYQGGILIDDYKDVTLGDWNFEDVIFLLRADEQPAPTLSYEQEVAADNPLRYYTLSNSSFGVHSGDKILGKLLI
jgi:hypothetical protein